MKRPIEVLRDAVSALRDQFSAAVNQSERTFLLGTVLLVSAVSAVVGYVLTQYYSVDVLSSLVSNPEDCMINWGPHIGRHCFSDYQLSGELRNAAQPLGALPAVLAARLPAG